MKIAVFTDLYLDVPGGIPSSIQAQATALCALGHEVTIFCPGHANDINNKKQHHPTGPEIVLLPTCKHLRIEGAPMARNPDFLERWIIGQYPMFSQYDIVHVHYEASASIAGARLARRFQIPLVQTMHGREDMAIATNIPHPFKTFVAIILCWAHAWYIPREIIIPQDNYLATTFARARMWTLMVNQANYADVVLTPSAHFAKKLHHYGVNRPMFPVSNGVSDTLLEQAAKTWSVRQLRANEPLKIIWNSRVSREKRIIPFLEAIKIADIPIKLGVYGSGNALGSAKRFAKKHDMLAETHKHRSSASTSKASVHFYGAVPHEQLLKQMSAYHLGVTVSYGFDTQGLTLLEAEATGLPVLYCDPDLGESLAQDGAVLTKTPDPADIAHSLHELYQHPERIAIMSRAMLAHHETVMQSRQIKRLLKVYRALLNSGA